jgi:hypothetical protein
MGGKAFLFLRIASVVSLLFATGHLLGSLASWSPAGETEVLRAMRSYHFDAGGVTRSYADFYLGFGHTISIYLLLQAVLLWLFASLARTEVRMLRPALATLFLANVASALVSWKFIFVIPVLFSAAIALCLAFVILQRPRSAGPGQHSRQHDDAQYVGV